jgi:type VI secretion system secreted protein VgrG
MAVTIVQTGRWLQLDHPLSGDVLVPTSFSGEEALSRPFSFELGLASNKTSIAASDLLGKSVTLSISRPGGTVRAFNALVTAFSAGPLLRDGYRAYRARLQPWLSLLNQTSDSRVFQNKSVDEIAKALFGDAGFSDYEINLQGTHPKREYCVQYQETDLAFLSRLFEEEGIFYFFKHESGKHTLVLADSKSAYLDSTDKEVHHRPGGQQLDAIDPWEPGFAFRTGKWALNDYNFETPTASLASDTRTVLDVTSFTSWERYEYPGRYATKDDGTRIVKLRQEEEEAGFAVVGGAGAYAGFSPGYKFKLVEHPLAAEQNKEYVLVSVRHEAADNTHFSGGGDSYYRNSFSCISDQVVFRPTRTTPRPVMSGPQTALVVGPSGQEIYCDKYGRIRVQFFWDRLGTNDEKSSCWVRVVQSLAGRNWGTMFTPRIGMEVVVDFLEGDPDRPLVTGAVYNATNMPPWTLPDNKTQSGFLSRSSMQGDASTANELRLEDKKGSELFFLHAEKDFTREVENDDTLTVSGKQTATITKDRSLTVSEGDETYTISKGDRTVAVSEGKYTLTVHGNYARTVEEGDESLTVSKGSSTTTVSQGDSAVTVSQGKHTLSVAGDCSCTVDNGNHSIEVKSGNQSTKASAGTITLDGAQSVEIKCGQSSIKIEPAAITIKSTSIKLQADAQVTVQGAMTTVKGDGTLTLKGGMVMIN